MDGWHGRVLRINLSDENIAIEEIDIHTAKEFIGGRGWAIKYLYDEMDPSVDPLSPDESIVFDALGPYPLHIDDLVHKISIEPGKLLSTLLRLELKGFVLQSPGKYFTKSEK